MNLEEIMDRVNLGVQRDDLSGYLRSFVNEARKELMKIRDWTFCHADLPLVIPNGEQQVELFPDFKAFGDQPAVFLVSTQIGPQGTPVLNPCRVMHRASFQAKQARSILAVPFVPPLYNSTFNFPMWWDIVGGKPMLGLPLGVPAQGDLTFQISYYRYLPPLMNPNDMDEFTTHHENMLIDMAKYFAFKSINDPMKADCFNDAMASFKVSAAKDDHIKLAGVSLRMGG